MRIIRAASARSLIIVSVAASAALCVMASPAAAQSVGIGGRLAWVTADSNADVDSVRFTGGQIRLLSTRFGLELARDRHSESFDLLGQKVTQTPIQASLLLRLGARSVSPYLLAGPGWYRLKVEPIDDPDGATVETTEFGWHAGLGLELRPSRQFGLHGDYRYTFLDFSRGDDDGGLIGSLLPGHRGSMWTLGATIYF
jgi:opacity protein-like surface antigen